MLDALNKDTLIEEILAFTFDGKRCIDLTKIYKEVCSRISRSESSKDGEAFSSPPSCMEGDVFKSLREAIIEFACDLKIYNEELIEIFYHQPVSDKILHNLHLIYFESDFYIIHHSHYLRVLQNNTVDDPLINNL